MLRIIDCLTLAHDPVLVALAAVLCVVGCCSTVLVAGRVTSSPAPALWIGLASACFASTAWATHFVAMLAYESALSITYAAVPTLASLAIGAVGTAAGFALAGGARRGPALRALGGAIVGASILGLHYVGMAGLRFDGTLRHDLDLVVASIVSGVGLGAVALLVLFDRRSAGRRLAGGVTLLLMTVCLHFVGTSAITLELGLGGTGEDGVGRPVLAAGVAVAVIAVLATGTCAALLDRRMSMRLLDEAERLRTFAEGTLEGLVVHRDHVLVDANPSARRLLGLDAGPVAGRRLTGWPADLADADAGTGPALQEVDLPGADGRAFPAELARRRIVLPDGSAAELVAIRDLSALREGEARVKRLASHDALTGLPNQRRLAELIDEATAATGDESTGFALLAIDLEGFRTINELHGLAVGDAAIEAIAARLRDALDERDVVARLDGDGFAVLRRPVRLAATAERLAEHLLEVIHAPVSLDEHTEIRVSASIGIAFHAPGGEGARSLLVDACTAMYRATARGRGVSRLFDEGMNAEIEMRRRLKRRLREALDAGELRLDYQPVVAADSGEILCFEALLRWEDPTLGQVPPAEFVPIAENSGLIVPIGRFVLESACRAAATWPGTARVAVNLSAVHFRGSGLVATVAQALRASGLAGNRLELEITEAPLVENAPVALDVLRQLRGLGVHIVMDNFGSGAASLIHLQGFAFHKLKIDRAFVTGVTHNAQNEAIVRAIVALGTSLSMDVVAMGVETRAQRRLLQLIGCHQLQGHLISPPVAERAVAGLVAGLAAGPVAGAGPDGRPGIAAVIEPDGARRAGRRRA